MEIKVRIRVRLIVALFLSINQSINLFVQMQNKHWTGHQGRMQPPLTGAHKNNVSNILAFITENNENGHLIFREFHRR